MKISNILAVVGLALIVITIISLLTTGESEEDYIERIKEEREETRRFMRTSAMSPFREQEIPFDDLNYYPPKPEFKIDAVFKPHPTRDFIMLPTSDNKELRYRKYGVAEFKFRDRSNQLMIFELADGSENEGHLFIPFGDATSANTTYGGGRYIDIQHSLSDDFVTIDFNKAYNPYCAYSEKYSCPLPPAKNLLEIAIEAGEKTYE